MSEKDLDASNIEYTEEVKSLGYIKKLKWDMAIGLQKVDNLKPSNYLEQLMDGNIHGKLTTKDVEKGLRLYYEEKGKKQEINYNELECDFVATRIVELLEKNNFELSVDYIKYIHKYLFQDIFEFAGTFKDRNWIKKEPILNRDTVLYGDYKTVKESLEYDISLEKEKNYKEMSIVEVIDNITKFSSSIWQVHPFREGNTRTTALFIEKYLISLGFNVDNNLFKNKSVYFRIFRVGIFAFHNITIQTPFSTPNGDILN